MNKLHAVTLSCLMMTGMAHADCLKGKPRHSARRQHEGIHRLPSTSTLRASISKPRRRRATRTIPTIRQRPSCPTERFRRAAPREISSSARHTPPAAELETRPGVPNGKVYSFTMSSNDSTVYNPGMIRDDQDGCLNASVYTDQLAPGDKSNILVPTAHAGIWTRDVDVYVPAGYAPGSELPFIVLGDGGPPRLLQ